VFGLPRRLEELRRAVVSTLVPKRFLLFVGKHLRLWFRLWHESRHRGERRMFALQWLVLVWWVTLAASQPAPPNCCATKTVGGVDYTFVREDNAAISYSCLSSCVYERNDQPGTAFCFAQGDQEVVCGDSTQGEAEDKSCPGEQPQLGSPCSLPQSIQCNYGEECCCGECAASLVLSCFEGSWGGFHTDFCFRPQEDLENC